MEKSWNGRPQSRLKVMPIFLAWPKRSPAVTPILLADASGGNKAELSDQAFGDVETHVTRFCHWAGVRSRAPPRLDSRYQRGHYTGPL